MIIKISANLCLPVIKKSVLNEELIDISNHLLKLCIVLIANNNKRWKSFERPILRLMFLSLLSTSSIIIINCIYDINLNNSAYAEQLGEDSRKNIIVTIPKGTANPEVDITKLGPRQWYLPRQVSIIVNDTITWTNS